MSTAARYPRVVRRLTLLAVLVLGLAACGGSGVPKDALKIKFGRLGGLIVPYAITIAPDGKVTAAGNPPVKPPTSLTSAQVGKLSGLVRDGIGKLKSLQCAHALPDEATYFITALGKTVSVHGTCKPDFTKLLDALTNELGLNQ